MDIRTEIDIKNYVFKIFVDGRLHSVIKDNYGKFNLILDLIEEGYPLPPHCVVKC